MNLAPLPGYLAALADSDISAVFYIAALYQLMVLGLGLVHRVKRTTWYAAMAAVSHLLLTAFLVIGFYYATRSAA
jgi:hypothetical protein